MNKKLKKSLAVILAVFSVVFSVSLSALAVYNTNNDAYDEGEELFSTDYDIELHAYIMDYTDRDDYGFWSDTEGATYDPTEISKDTLANEDGVFVIYFTVTGVDSVSSYQFWFNYDTNYVIPAEITRRGISTGGDASVLEDIDDYHDGVEGTISYTAFNGNDCVYLGASLSDWTFSESTEIDVGCELEGQVIGCVGFQLQTDDVVDLTEVIRLKNDNNGCIIIPYYGAYEYEYIVGYGATLVLDYTWGGVFYEAGSVSPQTNFIWEEWGYAPESESTDVDYTYTFNDGSSTTVSAEEGVEPTAPDNTETTVVSNENGTHTVTTYSWPEWVEGTTEYTEVATAETVDCTMETVSTIKATCVTADSVTTECSVCGYSKTVTGDLNPANHEGTAVTNEDSYVAPTRGEDGKEADTVCSVCGDVITEGAVIEALGVQITVEGTDGLGTVTLNGTAVEFGSTTKVDYESGYTLVAAAADGAEFVGWSVSGKIISTSATYATAAYADMTFVAVFNEVDTEFTVTFMDSFGMVLGTISSDALGDLTEEDLPDVYTYLGYTFTGWSMSIDEINALDSAAVVTAQYTYTKDGTTYTVTAEGATITVDGVDYTDTAQVSFDAYVTVKADGAAVWYVNGATAAYGDEYSFYVTANVTVTFDTDAIDAEPTVTAVSVTYVDDSDQVRFLASRNVPEGYSVVESGFLYGKDYVDAEASLVLENANVSGSGVYVYNNSSTSNEGQFALIFGISAKTGVAYARAYVIVADSEGDTSVIYADVQSYDYDA